MMLRNIIQAYTQSKIELNYKVICNLPIKLKKRYPKGIFLRVVKPLYGQAKDKNR